MGEKRLRMNEEEIKAILCKCRYGILSMSDGKGRPYGVPMNYFYQPEDQALYFHCARKGKKLDFLKENPQVSFVAVESEQIIEEEFTTHYRSVLVEGKAHMVEEEAEKIRLLRCMCERLAPNAPERREEVIERYLPAVCLIRLDIEQMSGKSNVYA